MPTFDNPFVEPVSRDSSETAATFRRVLPRERGSDNRLWFYAVLLGVALFVLYVPVFRELWDLWMTREDYSHGFLIPLMSLYLTKTKWPDLAELPIKPAPVPGSGLVLLSLAALFVGIAGGVITLSSVSFIGMLAGLMLVLFGRPCLKALAFPIIYLTFMTPVLDVVVEPLHQPLQALAAKVVSLLFQSAGVPIYLDGTFIHFPNGVLEVAVQCSGAGYLIAVLAIGLPLASVALCRWRSRLVLIMMALLISVVANWARVALIGMIGYLWGWGPQVHGPFHILQGMLVYWIGFGGLFVCAWTLSKMEQGTIVPAGRPGVSVPRKVPAWQSWRRQWRLLLAILLPAIVYLYGYDRGPVAAKESFATFPSTIGEWAADGPERGSPLVKIAGADHEVIRTYRKAGGSAVRLYIAYLDSQMQGKELVSYLTAPLHRRVTATTMRIGTHHRTVNIGFAEEHGVRTPILFWYSVNGRSIADRYEAKAATIGQALRHEGSNGALVLICGEPHASNKEAIADEVEAFARALFPVIQRYVAE
ncbi:exosortase W [Nitrospira sp. Nam80]